MDTDVSTSVQPSATRRELRARTLGAAGAAETVPTREKAWVDGPSTRRRDRSPLSFGHYTAIDGARGIAILSVLLYHSGWSERGLFGVDAFFVISGFLITLLLIKEATKTGRIRIGKFYGRRAKRLLPPLVLTLGLVLLLVWQLGTLDELKKAGETAVASLLQVANWHQIGGENAYWEANGDFIPLGQMWSLSATEQFYVVWPLAVAALWFISRRKPMALTMWLFGILVAAALVAPLLFDGSNSDRLYLGTDARAVSFVAGAAFAALVAFILQRGSRWAGEAPTRNAKFLVTAISVVSLSATIGASIATTSYHEPWLYQGGFAVVSVMVAIFIATLCFPANRLSGFFNWRPFRQVGILSYSMFLLHLPVFWALDRLAPDANLHPLVLFVLGTIVTWLAATLMHYLWSEPLRTASWKPRTAIICIVLSFSLVAALSWYLPIQRVGSAQAAAQSNSQTPTSANQVFAINEPLPLPAGRDGGPLKVAVIGDSVAGNMWDALEEYRTGDVLPLDITIGGCGIFDADSARSGEGYIMDTPRLCWPWQEKLIAANEEHHPDAYILHNLWDANEQLFEGEWIGPETEEWQDRYRSQLERLVEIGNSTGQPPLILLSNDHPRAPDGPLNRTQLDFVNAVSAEIAAKYPNVMQLDFEAATCVNGTCLTADANGKPIYVDGAHFSPEGLAAMAPWLENKIAAGLSQIATP